jgi:hypothetical protein
MNGTKVTEKNSNRMKKILLILICLTFIASQGMAQSQNNSKRRIYNSNSSYNSNSNSNSKRRIYKSNSSYNSNSNSSYNYYYNRSRNWLDDNLYRSYKIGKTLSDIGMSFTLGGLAAMVIGFAAADKEKVTRGGLPVLYLSGEGAAMYATGLVFAVIGTPFWIVGNRKKRNAKNLRESGDLNLPIPTLPSPYLKLKTISNGMGLAFVF